MIEKLNSCMLSKEKCLEAIKEDQNETVKRSVDLCAHLEQSKELAKELKDRLRLQAVQMEVLKSENDAQKLEVSNIEVYTNT